MEINYTEEERYYKEKKKVQEIKKFYQHLTVYILTNPIIITVNLLTSPGFLYCIICFFGWGIALVLHGLKAFEYAPFLGKEWEQQKIKEIIEKETESKKTWE